MRVPRDSQAGAFFTNSVMKMMPQYASGILNGSRLPTRTVSIWSSGVVLVGLFGGKGHGSGGTALFLDQSCMAAMPVGKKHTCWSAAVHYPFVSTPLLVAQNHDSSQGGDVFGAEWWPLPLGKERHAAAKAAYLRYFGRQSASGIAEAVTAGPKKGTDGLFMPSCYQHTGNLCMRSGSRVRNVSYAALLADWFESPGAGRLPHVLLDDCNAAAGTDDPCNAFCDCPARARCDRGSAVACVHQIYSFPTGPTVRVTCAMRHGIR